jgi:ABC-type spermidine/putrescine transport system permease subunit I
MPDNVAGRRRRAAFFLALPSLVVFIGIGFVPLALVAIWSLWSFDPDTYWIKPVWSLASYAALLKSGRADVLLQTAGLAALTATASTLLAVPAATVIGLLSGPRRATLLLALFTIPFFTSGLVRAFAWRLVLGREGIINNALIRLGVVTTPVSGCCSLISRWRSAWWRPTFRWRSPIVLAFARIDSSVIRASQDLGAGFWTMF